MRFPTIDVPANSSRYFPTRSDALRQPTGRVRVGWDTVGGFLHNELFDESLIRHDEHYYTSVVDLDRVLQVPTLEHLPQVLRHLPATPRVVDIGCGQGDFVDGVRSRFGLDAVGYDPVVRRPSSYLFRRYWDETEEVGDLYVLRCVLPHIPDPWAFLAQLARPGKRSLALVEFQRLEWILDRGIWYQVSHDHVNLFRSEDFEARYDVVDSGTFRDDEWAWVLVDPATARQPRQRDFDLADDVARLFEERSEFLSRAAAQDRPVAVWGAAGKGIVLAHALIASGARDVRAIDADPSRAGRFMEVSGLEVLGPADALDSLPPDALVLVSNPNHLDDVRAWVDGRWEVRCATSAALTGGSDQR